MKFEITNQINEESIAREIMLNNKLEEHVCREDDLWKQQTLAAWLKEGDINTKIFILTLVVEEN